MAVLADAFRLQDFYDSQQKDFEIKQKRTMIHIPDIKFKLFLPCHFISPVDLRPARDARLDFMPSPLPLRIEGNILHQKRPRPDEAEISFDDVDQLRQFVEARFSDQPPRLCQPFFIA